jgi:hypothetical protein
MGDSGTELRADAGTTGKHRMPHGGHQARRGGGADGLLEMRGQRLLCQLV